MVSKVYLRLDSLLQIPSVESGVLCIPSVESDLFPIPPVSMVLHTPARECR